MFNWFKKYVFEFKNNRICTDAFIRIIYELYAICVILIPSITMPMFKETPFLITEAMTLSYFFEVFFCMPLLFIRETVMVLKNYKKDRKSLISFGIFVLVLLSIVCFTGNIKIVSFVFLVYFAKETDFRRLVWIYLLCKLVGLGVIIFSNIYGLVNITTDGRGISFGVKHSNMMARYLVGMLFAIYYLCDNRKLVYSAFGIVFIMCVFVMKSRTPVIVLVMFVLILLLSNKAEMKIPPFFEKIFVYSPLLMTALSFVMGYLLLEVITINSSMSVRFTECITAYRDTGLSLFARDYSDYYVFFDNCYANVLYLHGVVTFVIFIATLINANRYILKNGDRKLMFIMLCIYVYCLMEVLVADELIFVMMAYIMAKKNAESQEIVVRV